ncbi:hypothetical protein SEA_WEASELS2_127 [Rhodococcus phage Weasels2]|uniref:Uncharacterized protein n=1 Tax=Rhodococcus phage Weasels2 TaxID=1897437 RepID=A0A1I9SAA7_9CAUD|nr:hypothetical protein FDH04_gp282 [Rhodococcus phage Weasels2]AOZ63713.1 hypothetical protein SEA_WEASELS2_127 [Rhodococcus phage Weasels2]
MTQYDATSTAKVGVPNPKRATHATYKIGRQPKLKYQTRGEAKNALRWCLSEGATTRSGNKSMSRMTVYKFTNDEYVPIFDSLSELAKAYIDAKITEDELFNLIDW